MMSCGGSSADTASFAFSVDLVGCGVGLVCCSAGLVSYGAGLFSVCLVCFEGGPYLSSEGPGLSSGTLSGAFVLGFLPTTAANLLPLVTAVALFGLGAYSYPL